MGIWELTKMPSWVVPKIGSIKNRYLARSIGAVFNYVCRTFTKTTDWVSGCGINSKCKHYWNCLTWVMLPINIHHWRMVITISFGSSFLQRFHQIFGCPLKVKIFNLQGSNIRCNNLLVSKNIISDRGSNMAPQRFYIHNHDHSFHWMNSDVNSYF
jgi:hypothetical protein